MKLVKHLFAKIFRKVKSRWFVFAVIFLLQFFLLVLVVYQNGRQQILLDRLAEKALIEDGRGNLFNEKLNSIEANILRLSAQIYRYQAEK